VQRSRRIGVGAGPIESPRLPFFWEKGLQEGLFANRESIVAPPLIVDSTAYAACLHGCTGCGVCTGYGAFLNGPKLMRVPKWILLK
jgi:hypothetical protein